MTLESSCPSLGLTVPTASYVSCILEEKVNSYTARLGNPNQPRTTGIQRQCPQKKMFKESFEDRVGKGIESGGKSLGKVWEVWKSRMRSGNYKLCSLAKATNGGMRPAGSEGP